MKPSVLAGFDEHAALRGIARSLDEEGIVKDQKDVEAELEAQVSDLAARLSRAPRQQAEGQVQQLDYLSLRLERALEGAAARVERRLRDASVRLAPALKEVVSRMEVRLQRAAMRLEQPLPKAVQRADATLREQAARLDLLNPYAVLGRGYSITVGADGHVVRRAADVKSGDRLTTRLFEGEVASVAV